LRSAQGDARARQRAEELEREKTEKAELLRLKMEEAELRKRERLREVQGR
jgi:hypothetical protein